MDPGNDAVSLASMTGFARAEGRSAQAHWTWEAKSVNGRGLDVRCRLPAGTEALEPAVHAAARKRLARGHVSVSLRFTWAPEATAVRLNRALLDSIVELSRDLGEVPGVEPARLDGLLRLRGVVEVGEPEESETARAEREAEMRGSLDQALDGLAAARRAEGASIVAVLGTLLDDIAARVGAAENAAAAQPDQLRARLRDQLAEFAQAVPPLPEDRLAQEVALLLVKSDVREELDRLVAHVGAARELLAAETAAGRELDFLSQELNREANTLCAKSPDPELTRIGLDLKALIDRFREQVQNLE